MIHVDFLIQRTEVMGYGDLTLKEGKGLEVMK